MKLTTCACYSKQHEHKQKKKQKENMTAGAKHDRHRVKLKS